MTTSGRQKAWTIAIAGSLAFLTVLATAGVAQTVDCEGVAEWNPTTIYQPGDRLVFEGVLYEANVPIWNAPPDYCPACGWYSTVGTCGEPTEDTTPPSVPTGLAVASRTTTSIALTWNASSDDDSGVAGYDVFRGGVLVGSPAATGFTDGGLAPDTTFSYAVRARDNAGNVSAASDPLSASTLPRAQCTTLPSVPTGLASPSRTSTSVTLSWNASIPGDGCSVRYRVFQGGLQVAEVEPTTTTIGGLASATTFSFLVAAVNEFGSSAPSAPLSVTTLPDEPPPPPPPPSDRLLIGYWHNFENGSGFIPLRDVSPDFDFINVAFAVSQPGSTSRMELVPDVRTSQAEMVSDIQILHTRGKRVQISIGGANSIVQLNNATQRDEFVSTMSTIVSTYGFDGLDIDLEGASLSLDPGDTDFRNPTTPRIVNLVSAVRTLHGLFGSGFSITMAPETFYVQVGAEAYSGPAGAYLPVIHGLRDILTVLHVQHYNTGSVRGLDGVAYSSATADFHVAMAEMVIQGFPVAGIDFPGLRPDQVAIGVPASPAAAGSGFTSVSVLQDALDRLITGAPHQGSYQPVNPNGYPGFRGLMTWSINWDRNAGFSFSGPHRAFLDSR